MTSTTSRRAVLAGAAAMPALALPAIASAEADPIFAAIAAHRAAWTVTHEFYASLTDKHLGGIKATEADEERGAELSDDDEDAALDLLDVQPTTVGGVLALLQYVYEHGRRCDEPWRQDCDNDDELSNWHREHGRPFEHMIIKHAGRSLAAIAERDAVS